MKLEGFIGRTGARERITEEVLNNALRFETLASGCRSTQEVVDRLGAPDWIDQPQLASCRFTLDGKDAYRERNIYYRNIKPLWLRIVDCDENPQLSWGFYQGIWVAGRHMLRAFYPANVPGRYSLEQIIEQERAHLEWDKVRDVEVIFKGISHTYKRDDLPDSYHAYPRLSEGDEVLIKE